jgi:murein DD-endopeptidase MepM/ murein hydrolase activator NlpD
MIDRGKKSFSFIILCLLLNGCSSNDQATPPEVVYVAQPSVYHVVKEGESIDSVASMYSMSTAQLSSLNRLNTEEKLCLGQRLLINPGNVDGGKIVSANEENVVAKPLEDANADKAPQPDDPSEASTDDESSIDKDDASTGPSAAKNKEGLSDASKKPTKASSSGYQWPVKGDVIKDFSASNPGINIKAPDGTPVKAITDGVVQHDGLEPVEGYGTLVVLQHGDQSMSIYGHLKNSMVKKGMLIKKGQVIGKVGKTGNVKVPQLHLQLRDASKKIIDPTPLLG